MHTKFQINTITLQEYKSIFVYQEEYKEKSNRKDEMKYILINKVKNVLKFLQWF